MRSVGLDGRSSESKVSGGGFGRGGGVEGVLAGLGREGGFGECR